MHHLLPTDPTENETKNEKEGLNVDPDAGYEEAIQRVTGPTGQKRDEWLNFLAEDPAKAFESTRVETIMKLYSELRQKYPEKSMIIFSVYLKFLDILNIAFLERFNIKALRYDGTMHMSSKGRAKAEFEGAHPSILFLITPGAGGVGLNLPKASIIIQTEIWWNHNVERQAYARAYRQGQEQDVLLFILEAINSLIDTDMRHTQVKKTAVNERLMGPILRGHDVPPQIPKIVRPAFYRPIDFEILDDADDTPRLAVEREAKIEALGQRSNEEN